MPRIYSFQADDETEALIEHDRAALSEAMGAELSVSQYMRLVVRDRIGKRSTVLDPNDAYKHDGYREGIRQGYHEMLRRCGLAMSDLIRSADVGDIDGGVNGAG